MDAQKDSSIAWLLLVFTLPSKRASQRVEVWRKLQRYGSVALGNSGYLLPNKPVNEERFQWLATAIRKYGGEASLVHVQAIDNISIPHLIGRFAEARAREYQELIRQLQLFSDMPRPKRALGVVRIGVKRKRKRVAAVAGGRCVESRRPGFGWLGGVLETKFIERDRLARGRPG